MNSKDIVAIILCISLAVIKEDKLREWIILSITILFLPGLTKIVTFLLGVVIAPFLTNIGIRIVFHISQPLKYGFKIDKGIIIASIAEELVWREIYLRYVLPKCTVGMAVIIGMITCFLFLRGHRVKDKKSYIEMTLYTILLYVSGALFPGMNYGLHCGRNCYVMKIEDEVAET